MRRVMINTQSFLFADAIAGALQRPGADFEVLKAERPEEVEEVSKWYAPYALLMEVTGYPPWLLSERLKIGNAVRAHDPLCKIVLMVDENAEREVAQQVCQAKKDGLIDNFVYGSISAAYLSAIMDTL